MAETEQNYSHTMFEVFYLNLYEREKIKDFRQHTFALIKKLQTIFLDVT